MRKFVIPLLFTLAIFTVQAQNIRGKIIDQENKPIEYATIILQTIDSVYVNTAYSDSLGQFAFTEDVNNFRLLVQHLLYNSLALEYGTKEVGKIRMTNKGNELNEIVVKGERPIVRVIDGKMTYDMPMLLQNKMASNAYEAILELPGVHEQNDAIQLAGSNSVAVIINGRPTTMSSDQLVTLLKNMPKERIHSAEVMYSAPPQYHVRGAAINLVLASATSETPRLQGQISGRYDQGYYASYQGSSTLLYSTPKTSTDLMYSFGYNRALNGDDIYSNHRYNDKLYDIIQRDRGNTRLPVHNIRLGHDWQMNDKNKLNLVYTTQIQQWGYSYTASKGTFSNSTNTKKTDAPVQMHNIALNYTSGFGLSTGADFTYYRNHTTQYYREQMEGKENAFDANAKQNIKKFSFYADQNHTLNKGWALNYGTKFGYASDRSIQKYHSLDGDDLSIMNSDNTTNEYTYNIYVGFSKAFSQKFSVRASLAGEYYKHKDIDFWSAFPTFEITYITNPINIFQLSVSSDKAYPSYWEMQDAISYLNGYAEIHGNSGLRPANIYSSQLNYIFKSKYIITMFASYIDNPFAQLPYQSPDRLALIYKTQNADYAAKVGLNLIIPFKVGSFFESRLTLNGAYDKTKSSHFYDISYKNDKFIFYSELNNTFNISPNLKMQLSGSYISPCIQGPMVLSKLYKVDAGIKWIFNRGNAEFNLKVNDMFNSWYPDKLMVNYKTQDLTMRMIPDARRISLSFTYKFGGFKDVKRKEIDTSRFGSK